MRGTPRAEKKRGLSWEAAGGRTVQVDVFDPTEDHGTPCLGLARSSVKRAKGAWKGCCELGRRVTREL